MYKDDRVTRMLIGFGGPDVLGEATEDIWRILAGNPDAFLEAGISRIYRHWQEHEFGLITAWRQYEDDCLTPRSSEVNTRNMYALRGMMTAAQLGHIRLVGHGIQDDMPVEEPSYLVVNRDREGRGLEGFRELLIGWASEAAWIQATVLYHNPETGSELIQVSVCSPDPDNPAALRKQAAAPEVIATFGEFTPAVRAYYSQRRKQWQQDQARQKLGEPPERRGVFALEFLRYGDPPVDWMAGMGDAASGDFGHDPVRYTSRATQTALVLREMCE